MALVSSLFTAISGMRNEQTWLDTISNNVANVNTMGFKAGRVQFSDLLSQTVRGATGSNAGINRGGVNPIQSGAGVSVAAIDTLQRQGTFQATGNVTDLALNGDGYFIAQAGNAQTYTRAGSFRFDAAGQLVDPNGGLIQGWSAALPAKDPLGTMSVDASNPAAIGNITVTPGQTLQAQETRNVSLEGNLDAGANYGFLANSAGLPGTTPLTVTDSLGTVHQYTVGKVDIPATIFDSLGNKHNLTVTFVNVSGTQINGKAPGVVNHANQWIFSTATDPNDPTVRLALDDMTYTDPVTGQLVRSSHAGELDFQTAAINGTPDEGSTSDVNSASDLASFGILADPHAGYFTGMLNQVTFPPSDPVPGTSPFDNPGVPGFPAGFTMQPCNLVLLYQSVPNGTPVPPAGTSAGTLVNVNYTEMTTTAATPTRWYAQKITMNYGTLSTLLGVNMDPDDDGILGSLVNGDGKTEISMFNGKRDGLTQDTSGSFQTINGVKVYVPKFSATLKAQDGRSEGILQSVSVDAGGKIAGIYRTQEGAQVSQDLAQVAIATFANPGGLAKVGDTHFAATANSGSAVIGTALGGGAGSVVSGVLEQSNVDLSEELTNMIVAQRGFEANARLITTSDSVLNTLVNLGR